MPKIKLVTNVSEYALLRGFARTRGRLVASTVLATGVTIGAGLWSAHYVLEVSSSVVLNLFLITFNMMLMLVAAYLQTVLVGDLFFSGPWREQVILGESPDAVTVQNHNAEFMIVLFLLVIGNAFAINAAAGGFLDTYHTEGFFRSRLRAEDPAERRAALEYMTDPMNFELWDVQGVQDLVVDHLDDPDPETRRVAIWNTGEMDIGEARDALIAIVEDPDQQTETRAVAAEALGKLGNREKPRHALEKLLSSTTEDRLLVAALRGLALMKSPLSIEAALPLTRSDNEEVMLHALWVLRNSGEPSIRKMLHEELDKDPKGKRRCALLDTLKMVATDEDVTWARRQFSRVDPEADCEPVIWRERNDRQHYVSYSDTFRVKYLKIVANATGGEHRAWFERIVADPEQPWRVREVASEIVKRLDEAGRK
jgi:hypothetical protein